MQKSKALITGASFGIGYELAKVFARHGHDLVLVARTESKLQEVRSEIEKEFSVNVKCISADLSDPASPSAIYKNLTAAGDLIDILVNNAGFGFHGRFIDMGSDQLLSMLRLNISALTELTHLFLQDMRLRGKGKILNIASTGAFQPGPYMAVYYASKAYVLHFSEALNYELKNTGITVTALCPGPTKSEFQQRAGMGHMKLFTAASMDARPVAELGYRAMQRGKAVAIAGWPNAFLAFTTRLGPRALVIWIVAKMQGGRLLQK